MYAQHVLEFRTNCCHPRCHLTYRMHGHSMGSNKPGWDNGHQPPPLLSSHWGRFQLGAPGGSSRGLWYGVSTLRRSLGLICHGTFPAHRCWIFSLHSVYAAAGKKSMGGSHKMNQFLYYLSFYSSGIPFDARDPSQKISRNLLSFGIISPETSKYISAFLFYFTKNFWNSPWNWRLLPCALGKVAVY